MSKKLFSALLSALMLVSCFGTFCISASEKAEVLSTQTVVFVNGSSTHDGTDEGTLEKPYKNFNEAVASIAQSGGTVVVTGATDCSTTADKNAIFENTGDILVTSKYNGIDYRAAFSASGSTGATLNVGSAPVANVMDNPGKITFDAIDIITTNWANWHFCGHGFELKDSVRHYYWYDDTSDDTKDRYYGATIQLMVLGSGKSLPATFGELPEIIVSESHGSPRIYLGARENVTIGGAKITIDNTVSWLVLANNVGSVAYPNHGALTINGDVKITVNGTVNEIKTTSYSTGESGLAAFNGDLTFIVNPGGTITNGVPETVKPTNGNFYLLNVADGATAEFGNSGSNIILTLDNAAAYNFVILENQTSGKSYAFPIENGVGNINLSESGSYNMSYTNADTVTVSFADTLNENTVPDAVTTATVSITMPKLENTSTHIFRGWTDTEGGDMKYEAGESVIFTENTTLYAVWSDAPKYTVTFAVDGESYAEFENIEGAKIEYPTEPSKDGYYFQKWDSTPEVIGTEDITINAVFVDKKDYGNVVYLDGTAASGGDGTIGRPYKTLKAAANPILEEGGTIVVKGVTTIEYSNEINNNGDILITSLDPITGNNYIVKEENGVLGEGAYLSNYMGAFLGNGVGKLSFDNVALQATKSWNFFNLCAGDIYLGANTKIYLSDGDTLYKGGYFGFASQHVADKNDINIKATIAAPASYYAAWLARIGASATINSADITFDTYVKFGFGNNNSSISPTVNGPVMFTVNKGGSGTVIQEGGSMLSFGAKSYLSIITNDATVTYTEAEALKDKTYRVSSDANGSVCHTGTKGKYKVVSDTHNFAVLLDTQNNTVSETVIGKNGGTLTAPDYGTYTVSYSNKTVYTLEFASQLDSLSDTVPEEYSVASDNTEGLTFTLPSPEKRTGYSFLGWAESNDGDVVYSDGASYTLTANSKLYAVWEEIKTYTVTFTDDSGNVLHSVTGYVGDPVTFPEKELLPWDYEKKLLGFRYSDDSSNTLISENALIPDADKTAVPLWGDIPANETRVYVDGKNGNDSNDGKTPSNAVLTIAKAVSLIKESGGIIVCTDGEITLTGDWHNSGDITLTSLDPLTGINYKASELSDDGLSWKSGAYLWHGAVQFGNTTTSGKISLDNLLLGTHGDYQFLNFDGHPFVLGKGISAFNRNNDTGKITTTQAFYMRALGEAGASRTNEEGITFTLNTLGNGATIYAVGKADNVIPAINITVDSEFSGTIQYGNNSNGGTTTLRGPGRFTFNADLKTSVRFPTFTNPVEGNLYVIYNNNSTGSVSNIVQADGYGIMTVTSSGDAKITHAANEGSFEATLNPGYTHKFIKVIDSDGNTVEYRAFEDSKASFSLDTPDDYTIEYTDVSCHRVTYVTGTDDVTVPDAFFEDGEEAELAANLYRYGYTFKGWSDGSKTYTQGVLTMPAEDVTLTAVWEESPKYTVSFDTNGVAADAPEAIVDYIGEEYALTKLSAEGRSFLGWSTDKNAGSGIMNHTIAESTVLYAIWSDGPAYIIESHFIDDERWQFQRYAVDIYLENAKANSGTVNFVIDNSFLYRIGRIPTDGIDSILSGSGKNCTLTWNGDIDSTNGRIRLARVMLFYTEYGMNYSEVEKRTSDEIVYPASGCIIDGESVFASANFYKGKKSGKAKISGKVTLEGRESGLAPQYNFAKLYILDKEGDAVEYIVLENSNTTSRTFEYSAELYPGEYTMQISKDTYTQATFPITVSGDAEIPEVVLYSGDTLDENGKSDGIIDTDDFIRVLRGFASDFPIDSYKYYIDLNEDGVINVSDLSIIKKGLRKNIGNYTIETVTDPYNHKYYDWTITDSGGKLVITGGSEKALENAVKHLENTYGDSTSLPAIINHTGDYAVNDIIIADTSISNYSIVINNDDEIAAEYAEYIREKLLASTGYALPITDSTDEASDYEIIIATDVTTLSAEKYTTYEKDGKIYLCFGDEQSAQLGADALCSKLLGLDSGEYNYSVKANDTYTGSWEVLTRFAVFSDTHVGKGKVASNPDWEEYDKWLKPVYDHINSIHADPETELDFVLSLGDNIDYGYDRNSEETDALRDYDYASYLETIKWLTVCDPVNPIENRQEGTIPHYELKGNHDPSGVIRFLDEAYWTTVNENGKKVAFIGFFTNYGGYPNINGDTSTYHSYGNLTDETVEYIESMILKAAEDGVEHIIISSHFGIAQDLGAPILPETGLGKIGSLCDKYGIKLHFNGHEHDLYYTVRKYNDIYDIDCSMTRTKHAVVEITTARAKITVYNSKDNSIFKEEIIPLS